MSLETQIKKAGLDCEAFNRTYPVGTLVKYWKRHRTAEPEGEAVTRTVARVVSGFAIVWLEGLPAGIKLKNIEPVIPDQQPFEWVEDSSLDGHQLCWEVLPLEKPTALESLYRVRVASEWRAGCVMRSTRYFFDEDLMNQFVESITQEKTPFSTRTIESIKRYQLIDEVSKPQNLEGG